MITEKNVTVDEMDVYVFAEEFESVFTPMIENNRTAKTPRAHHEEGINILNGVYSTEFDGFHVKLLGFDGVTKGIVFSGNKPDIETIKLFEEMDCLVLFIPFEHHKLETMLKKLKNGYIDIKILRSEPIRKPVKEESFSKGIFENSDCASSQNGISDF